MFEDANAWVALKEIYADVLRDPSLTTTYLIIDALDECVTDLLKLLDFIAKQSSASSRVKWIVSSRNWPEIEARLEQAGHKLRLSLELNAASVSTAVQVFIDQRVSELAQQNRYDEPTKRAVLKHLASNANDTFLWVALVCQHLQATAKRNVLRKLELFPPGLDALYKRMMQQISKTDDAELCKQVLATVALVYRPITLEELVTLAEPLEDVADDAELREIIGLCGSFLTLRGQTVYFVHQSAKEFLLAKAAQEVFPAGQEAVHQAIFARSLQIMSTTLRRDIYGLKALGTLIDDVQMPEPDPLAAVRYSCVYWVDHLCDLKPTASAIYADYLRDEGVIDKFLRERYLYWLECLGLCKSMSKGVVSVRELQMLVQVCLQQATLLDVFYANTSSGQGETTSFTQLVYDAYRFIMYHKQAIESSPLQAYGSALLFSPKQSLVRRLFQHEGPEGISLKPDMRDDWSACLQTLEGHSRGVNSVAFSHDSTRLASASWDNTVKLWDVSSGNCLQTFTGHSDYVSSVAFSHDSTRLASASNDNTVKLWDVSTGTCLRTFMGHSDYVSSVAFSPDSTRLASASHDNTVKMWDASSGACLRTYTDHSDYVNSIAFSHDSTRLASASHDNTVKMWDASSGACLWTYTGHSDAVNSIAFSHNSTKLASASWDRTIKIWNASSGACLRTFTGHSRGVNSVAFSHNSTKLASASWDSIVKMWDVSSGNCLQTFTGHSRYVSSVAFSHDSTRLASASYDSTVKLWDASSGVCLQTFTGHSDYVNFVAFSHDSTRLASASHDNTIKLWDASSGAYLRTFTGHSDAVKSVAFSHDSTKLASASWDSIVKLWDVSSGTCLRTFMGHSDYVSSVAFSHDSTRLASASWDNTVKLWDASSGVCLQTYTGHSDYVNFVAFSHDSTRLASACHDNTVKMWDASSDACLRTFMGHSDYVSSVAFSPDSTKLASASYDNTVKMWDASSGACLQMLDIARALYSLSFDPISLCLLTEIGPINVSASMGFSAKNDTVLQRPQYVGAGVSLDSTLITCNGKNLLWIPPEYRPSCSSVCRDTIGMGVGSGRVWICSINLQMFSQISI
jgi:WD40 repeat protein